MEWSVQIRGESYDLEELSKSLNSPELCVTQEGQTFVLKSTYFNCLKNFDDVENRARAVLSLINGAARLALGTLKPLVVAGVVKVNDDGTREIVVSRSVVYSVRRRGSRFVVTGDSTAQEIHQADPIPSWIATARHDTNVAKVLRLFGAGAYDWVSLYRIYEVIESDVGGILNIVKKGWATERAIRRFKHTANSPAAIGDDARHGKETTLPKHPMAFSQAAFLTEIILHNWLRSKGG